MTDSKNLQPDSPRPGWFLWPALYLALRLAAPFLPVKPSPATDLVATVVFLLVPLLWIRALSRFWTVPPAVAVGLFAALALVWGEFLLGKPLGLLRLVDWSAHPDGARAMLLASRPVADLALITGAALLGVALARIITDPKMLLPVALAGALVDYWGVYMGTTNMAIQMAPELVRSVSAGIPTLGGGFAEGLQPAAFVGFGDWLFLAMFLAVTVRYDLHPDRTFWALLLCLIPAMLLVMFGQLDYLPAVVPMAIAVFAVNGRRLRLTRQEAISTVIAIALVSALLYAVFTLTTRAFVSPAPPGG